MAHPPAARHQLLMGLEPMTSSLPRTRSTTELQQRALDRVRRRAIGSERTRAPGAHRDRTRTRRRSPTSISNLHPLSNSPTPRSSLPRAHREPLPAPRPTGCPTPASGRPGDGKPGIPRSEPAHSSRNRFQANTWNVTYLLTEPYMSYSCSSRLRPDPRTSPLIRWRTTTSPDGRANGTPRSRQRPVNWDPLTTACREATP
jgi:hypothetical protein